MTRNYLFARGINACAYLKLMYFFVRFFKFLCLLGLSLEYHTYVYICLLYTSDAADELDGVDVGGGGVI